MNDILFTLWFFAPAAVANMSPIFANNIPKLQKFDKTLDMGKKYRGKRIFGEHKTFRGLLSGIVSGTVTIGLQIILFNSFSWAQSTAGTLVDYTNPLILFLGAVLGLGALTGDAVKSFFKRQFNVAPGRGWFPFDQTDFIIWSNCVLYTICSIANQNICFNAAYSVNFSPTTEYYRLAAENEASPVLGANRFE